MLVVLTWGRAKCKMYPTEVEKIGGGCFSSSVKKFTESEPTKMPSRVRVQTNVAAATLGGGWTSGAPPPGGPTGSSSRSSPTTSTTRTRISRSVVPVRPAWRFQYPEDDGMWRMIIYNLLLWFFHNLYYYFKMEGDVKGVTLQTKPAPADFVCITTCCCYSHNSVSEI